MICVAVTYDIRPGHEDEAAALFGRLAAATRAEPGCRLYLVHRAPDNPCRFFLYEQYDDQAALDAHRASPHFEALGKASLWPITERRAPEVFALVEA